MPRRFLAPLVAVTLAAILSRTALAVSRPSFDLDTSAFFATDIVVTAQGAKASDPLTILETWKGTLQPGSTIIVSALPMAPLPVTPIYRRVPSIDSVTGARIILFLKRPKPVPSPTAAEMPDAAPRFVGAQDFGGAQASTVWIEHGHAYSYLQLVNPGPSEIHEHDLTEPQMKGRLLMFVAADDLLRKAATIPNLPERAQALAPMATSALLCPQIAALKALGQCGKAALPILLPLVHDGRVQQPNLVEAVAAAAGGDDSAILADILEKELPFWELTAPSLQKDWFILRPAQQIQTTRTRMELLQSSLRVLARESYVPARPIAARYYNLWASNPALDENAAKGSISRSCIEILILPAPATAPAPKSTDPGKMP